MRLAIIAFVILLPSLGKADKVSHRAEVTRLSDLSIEARGKHDYEKALEYVKAAIELNSTPNLHYNMGLILEDMGRNEEALFEFKKFLKSSEGDASARPFAIKQIEALNLKLHSPSTMPPSLPAPKLALASPVVHAVEPSPLALTAPAAPKRKPNLMAPILTGAAGVVLTAVGGGLYGASESSYHALESTCKSRLCTSNDWGSA